MTREDTAALYEDWKKIWPGVDRLPAADAPVLTLKAENTLAEIRLLPQAAPLTCAAFLQRLPLTDFLIHAAWSGDYVRAVRPVALGDCPRENPTSYGVPGDLCWFPGNGELSICYGEARAQMPYGPVQVSVFGVITKGLPELVDVFRRTRLEGAKAFSITQGSR